MVEVSLSYVERITQLNEELMSETQKDADAIPLQLFGKINYLYGYIRALHESMPYLKKYNQNYYVGERKQSTKREKGRKKETV